MQNPLATIFSQLSSSSQHAFLPYSNGITERKRPNSSKRVRTFPNDVANSGLDDEIISDNEVDADAGYLWYSTHRREKRPSPPTPAHQAVVASTLLLLQAHILTGQGGPSCTPWPKESKAWFNNEMADVWQGAAKRYRAKFGDRDRFVNKLPDRWEAQEASFS